MTLFSTSSGQLSTRHRVRNLLAGFAIALLASCSPSGSSNETEDAQDPFPSTYEPASPTDYLIRGATILDGAGNLLPSATVLVRGGRIAAIGEDIEASDDLVVIDAAGKFVTPGIIDPHTHVGNATPPFFDEEIEVWDVNEKSSPFTASLRAETALRAQDPAYSRLRAAGVTTIQILPGSTNLFAGQGVVTRTLDAVSVQDIKFPGASRSLKMACGENPKYTYGEKGEFPTSRMGIESGQRRTFERASAAAASGKVRSDLEPIVSLLQGGLHLHIHCYSSDDMTVLLAMADEFDFHITAFHHAAEAYKIADRLAEKGVCAVVWSDWWGFKREIFDGVRANAAILEQAGVCVALHSDSSIIGQRLTIEAAKAMTAGRRAGIDIPPETAIKWITSNPARMLGIADETGSLEPGKRADLVIWSGDPFSIYSLADLVLVDGVPVFERRDGEPAHLSDFELGQPAQEALQ
ncbi:MAG: amidohydrolase [Henriciella sp.]